MNMSTSRSNVLVIDDEPQIRRFLGLALEANGFVMVPASTGSEGLAAIAIRPPDAVVLDLGLPDIDGHEVLVEARKMFPGPIMILSARHRESEKVRALENSADDYIEKPFGINEFIARLRTALRHRILNKGAAPSIRALDVEIDMIHRVVSKGGLVVHLSPREYELLAQLAQADGRVLTHAHLLRTVWSEAQSEAVQYLRVFIGRLRQKLETDASYPQIILTIPGVGYKFVSDRKADELSYGDSASMIGASVRAGK